METSVQLELKLSSQILDASRSTQLLDTAPEESFDRLTRLSARLLGAPTSLVTVLDGNRQFFKSATGLGEPWATRRETPLTHSFCQYVVKSGQPLIVSDAREDELLKTNLAIPDLGVIAYIGVPLQINHVSFGALCVIDGEPREWSEADLATLNDLSAQVQTEMELRLRGLELEATNKHLSEVVERQNEFLGMAAHDMRSPLTVAYGYAKIMASPRLGLAPAHQKMAQSICDSCNFMVGLIDDLLDLEALKSGKLTLHRSQVDCVALVERTVEMNRMMAGPKETTIELETPDGEVPCLTLDSQKIEQVLNNLLGNAIKYSPPKSCIQVKLERKEAVLEVRVRDQGHGIAPERLPTIFNPFQRGEAHGQRGAGLGLAIVQRIVTEHGGHVWVDSQLGQGSTFTFQLPIKSA